MKLRCVEPRTKASLFEMVKLVSKSFEREEGFAVFVRLREEGFAGSVRVSVCECMHEGLGKKKEGRDKGAGKIEIF